MDLSEQNAAALKAQVGAAQMPPDYGLLANHGRGPRKKRLMKTGGTFYCICLCLLTQAALAQISSPSPLTVVSAATNGPPVAPGSLASIVASQLSTDSLTAQLDATGSYPTSLAGTTVSVNGELAELVYVSPGQINFVVPADTTLGSGVVVVTSPAAPSPIQATANIVLAAPGLFSADAAMKGGLGSAAKGNAGQVTVHRPRNPGLDTATELTIFGTGFVMPVTLAEVQL